MKQNRVSGLILSGLILLICPVGMAQETRDEERVEKTNALIAFQVAIPSAAMQPAVKNNMGNLGFGGALCVLTNPFSWGKKKRNSPLRIGAEAGYTYYGRFLSDVNINGYHGDYKTSYGILQLNAVLRLCPSLPQRISPFFEMLAGGNFYLSATKENLSAIESGLGIPSFDIGSYSSASVNKGIAIGCRFGKVERGQGRLIARLSYNWGNRIRYVVRNSLDYNPSSGRLEYYVGEAPVKYVMIQLGVGI